MRFAVVAISTVFLAGSAAAQTHARHTAVHDSAHAIALSDADHLALHQFLLGRWTGVVHHDTLTLHFENDSDHQQLMIRNREGVAGFLIRGDSLQWKQSAGGTACTASTSVSSLVAATKTKAAGPAQMKGTLLCGTDRSQFILKKLG